MAGTEPQKQLLSLIRDFASERSQGERRVVGFKKRIEELRSQLEGANAELEDAKRFKEATEQELKGYEVELAVNEASIQALEARISLIQDEISDVGNEVEALKNEEGAARDRFIGQMFELNTKIRKIQEMIDFNYQQENGSGTTADTTFAKKDFTVTGSSTLEDLLAHVVSQIAKEEDEYLAEQNIQKQLQLELIDYERKVSLMEVIMKATKALQDLTRYPYKNFSSRFLED